MTGLFFSPLRPASRPRPLGRIALRASLAGALALALLSVAGERPATAATSQKAKAASAKTAQPAAAAPAQPDKMLVEAAEMRSDSETNTVSAVGDARVYYKGSVLEADRVTYDRNTGRVFAEGRAKLTQPDGNVIYGDRFDLTDDFRDGFIESLRAETTDKTFLSAPRAERIENDTTVFDKGAYTACAPCKGDPEKPPLWRVRAKRIIHKNDEQMIYYEDASLEFLGLPLAYVPFFSSPDPTVTRKSGVLSPHFISKSALGSGLAVPIFWALAPDYDITFTPTALSKQGFLGEAEWRQRLENGQYYIRAYGIDQLNPTAFSTSPWGAGDQKLRGSFESAGEIRITDQWKFGWAFTILSDKFFINDYSVSASTLSSNYISETTSTVYLTGKSDRSFFDLRGYYFEGLSTRDFQPQQPLAHPVWDYNRIFDVDPAKSWGIGGQIEADFNLTSLSAAAASFQSVGTQVLDNAYQLYNVCTNYVPGTVTGTCLLRGVGGEYTRASLDLSWKRKFIDPIGEVWTPFAFTRFNGEWVDINTSNAYTFSSSSGSSTFYNSSQLAFLGNKDSSFYGALIPGVGLEYRYPFFAKLPFGSLTFSPIGQIILRPNGQVGDLSRLNLDAQSLVFDESTLFEWNKYSGYDRFETGIRANYGGQATLHFDNGGYVNLVGGQSYQVAGMNSYATADAANVGLSSGLDTRASDYVGALSFAPNSIFSFTAKSRFDVNTFEPRRIDLVGNYNLGAWTGGVQYANYQAQPVIGYYVRREGLSFNSRYNISENYFAQGNITFDMSRQFYPASLTGYTYPSPFSVAAFGLGGGYKDDCTTFTINYSSNYWDNGNGALAHNQTVLLQLTLRTLGGTSVSQNLNATTGLDGTKY